MVRSFPFRFARPAQSEALGEDLGTIRAGATGATLDGQARRGDATYAPQIWGWHLKSGELTGGTTLAALRTDDWHLSGRWHHSGSGFGGGPNYGPNRRVAPTCGGTNFAEDWGWHCLGFCLGLTEERHLTSACSLRTGGWPHVGTDGWHCSSLPADTAGDELTGGTFLAGEWPLSGTPNWGVAPCWETGGTVLGGHRVGMGMTGGTGCRVVPGVAAFSLQTVWSPSTTLRFPTFSNWLRAGKAPSPSQKSFIFSQHLARQRRIV